MVPVVVKVPLAFVMLSGVSMLSSWVMVASDTLGLYDICYFSVGLPWGLLVCRYHRLLYPFAFDNNTVRLI